MQLWYRTMNRIHLGMEIYSVGTHLAHLCKHLWSLSLYTEDKVLPEDLSSLIEEASLLFSTGYYFSTDTLSGLLEDLSCSLLPAAWLPICSFKTHLEVKFYKDSYLPQHFLTYVFWTPTIWFFSLSWHSYAILSVLLFFSDLLTTWGQVLRIVSLCFEF